MKTMKKAILTLQTFLIALAISIVGCNKINSEGDNFDTENEENIGKGTGKIEFRGKSYPLNESHAGKMTSWSPPPLGISFYDADNDIGNGIIIMISSYLYDTWSSFELPAGTYENITHELALNNYGIQGLSTLDKLFNTKMVVKKSGNNYEITLTGKTWLYLEGDNKYEDFKMTWKGEIKLIDNNETPIKYIK